MAVSDKRAILDSDDIDIITTEEIDNIESIALPQNLSGDISESDINNIFQN